MHTFRICTCGHSEQVHYPNTGCLLCSCKKYRPSYVQLVRESKIQREEENVKKQNHKRDNSQH